MMSGHLFKTSLNLQSLKDMELTGRIPQYISHIKKNLTGEVEGFQSNEEHCLEVAKLAKQFASEFGMGEWGYVLGILHDKGKESKEFQEYIQDVNGIPGHKKWTQKGKAHAYVGALIAQRLYGNQSAQLFCNPIASHHRGLYDYCELENLLTKQIPGEIETIATAHGLNRPPFKMNGNELHHLVRMMFSCLVDADYLNTELFMNEQTSMMRGSRFSLQDLMPLLERHFEKLQQSSVKSDVNHIRQEVQTCCRKMSKNPRGSYSLTVPTGGGKTLSSLVWAMQHAVHHGMKRIVIAIPYTSIIVQTAAILKEIFGENAVLEHHSNFDPNTITDSALRHQAKLATENWDYPIIVTTNVQLFESMFCNRPSDCRKLHNLTNSVIVLDEVQTLPTDFLQPIVDALKAYQHIFGISVLFTTASQPVLSGIIEGCNPKVSFSGIDEIKEIIPRDYVLHDRLRRVHLEIDDAASTYDEIADRLAKHKRVLCIVNTRNDAREIFTRLPQEGLTVHLSRMMCPRHVGQTIEKIKHALSNDTDEIIRVVATQLIEAGVDIDFPVVYRQEAGLDSILQAAGRCNREGKLEVATTRVFSLSKEHLLHGKIVFANQARLNMKNVKDWFAPETMTEFFRQYYSQMETFDKEGMKDLLYNPKEICFEDASQKFRLIEDGGVSVIVNTGESMALVEQLKKEGMFYALMKQLSQYSVTIHKGDFEKLKRFGAVEEIIESIFVVNDRAQYDECIGLRLDNHWLSETLII